MSFTDFIGKYRRAGSSVGRLARSGIEELHRKVNGRGQWRRPEHIDDQYDRIGELFRGDETAWLLFFDGGRYDMFDQLVWDYFDGDLSRVWNGGVGYTGDWAVRHLTRDFGNRGLFSWVPLRGFGAADYDGREHFAVAPRIQEELAVEEQLAALGYMERQTDDEVHISPANVNEAVLDYKDGLDGGVIRYLKPHPPFEGLQELTGGGTKTEKTRQALDSGSLSYRELTDAYRDTYRVAFEHAAELIPRLDGRVVITADHGTCLTCGQLFHGRQLEKHDHLCVVPWMVVDR